MNNNSEFQKITKYVLFNGGSLDWNELYKTSLSVIFDGMARTRQNPAYHKEIDVRISDIRFIEIRHFLYAIGTPGRPKVYHNGLTDKITEAHLVAEAVINGKIGCGAIAPRGVGGRGVIIAARYK